MKTKQEQIKEMAKERNEIRDIMKLLDKCVSLNPMDKSEVASVLYGNNYRKLPEDSVVLSREEYEMLKSLYDTQKAFKEGYEKGCEACAQSWDNGYNDGFEDGKEQAYKDCYDITRKETAKEILDKLNALMEQYHYKSTAWRNCTNFIKETYGVEVEE